MIANRDEGDGELPPWSRPLNPARLRLINAAHLSAHVCHSLSDGLHASKPVLGSLGFDARHSEL
jgi:hypothetical protein